MHRSVLVASVIVLLLRPSMAIAQVQAGAVTEALRSAAERGNAQAQLDYAKALGSQHPDARAWAQHAADQGLAEAWFWLGYHAPGDEATPFYERAADAGYPDAFEHVFDRWLFRADGRADVARAKRYADLARSRGLNGVVSDDAFATIDRCAEAGAPVIPASHRPSPDDQRRFAGVACLAFSEGLGVAKDLVAYRMCLLADDPPDNNWLAEVYANGWGVPRHPRLALALACHGSDVPAELIALVNALWATREQSSLDEPFRFCDHVVSGYNAGRCAARDEELHAARRAATLDALSAAWPPAHVEAFARLREAAHEFFSTRATEEVDMTGTMRAALAFDEEATLHDAFVDVVRKAAGGVLPPRADLRRADAALNRAYREVMGAELDLGTVTHDSIPTTQRTWLAYRDAWGTFGALHFPQRSTDEWKAWATTARTRQLRALMHPEE